MSNGAEAGHGLPAGLRLPILKRSMLSLNRVFASSRRSACFSLSRFAASSANLTETIEQEVYMANIFVGNLSYSTTQEDLLATFSQFGNVERVNIVTDRDSGQPRGFAFVEMTDHNEAQNAIAQLNGAELHGRAMNVNEARPKPAGNPGRGGFGGGRKNNSRGRW